MYRPHMSNYGPYMIMHGPYMIINGPHKIVYGLYMIMYCPYTVRYVHMFSAFEDVWGSGRLIRRESKGGCRAAKPLNKEKLM